MKNKIYIMVIMVMLFMGSAMAQQLTGESAPFVFNTQETQAVPLSPLSLVLTVLLVASYMLYRFLKQKSSATA